VGKILPWPCLPAGHTAYLIRSYTQIHTILLFEQHLTDVELDKGIHELPVGNDYKRRLPWSVYNTKCGLTLPFLAI
jgi:hypothetical protein